METALAIISTINAVQFFQPGASASVIEKLKIEVREQASRLDISTKAGRDAIISLTSKIAKSKTGLDKAGKELVQDQKAQLALIDKERATVWDELEALQKEVRKPITDWEEADKKRTGYLEFKVVEMAGLGSIPYGATTADIEALLAKADALDMTNMQEFTSRAELAEAQIRKALISALAEAKQRDAEKAENKRLRTEAAIREQRERDEHIANEAREKAYREIEVEHQWIEQEKFEAEARARQAEAARVEYERSSEERRIADASRAKQEAEDAAKCHAEAMEAARTKAKADAEESECKRQEEHVRHEEAIRVAAVKAEQERLAAIEAERERVADKAHKAEAEIKAREKDKAHKAEVNSNALAALIAAGISHDMAKLAIQAIAKGSVPNVRISY